MIEQIKKLTLEEKEVLFKAPILVSFLAASRNHEISEKAEALELEHIKTFSADPLLLEYNKVISNNFQEHFKETVKKDVLFNDAKREALKKEIDLLNAVIAKPNKEFTKTLHNVLAAYAEHVKKADRNSLLRNFIFPIHGFTN
jgi:hypothetical protein